MRLSLLLESVSWDKRDLVRSINDIGIECIDYYDDDRVQVIQYLEIPIDRLQDLKYLLRHAKWQIQGLSNKITRKNTEPHYLATLTPLNNAPYKHKSPILYHVTDKSNVSSILKNGIVLRSDAVEMRYPKRVYLYPDRPNVHKRMEFYKTTNNFASKRIDPVLLKINNSDNSIKLFVDPEMYMGFAHDDPEAEDIPLYTTRSIPPERIEVAY